MPRQTQPQDPNEYDWGGPNSGLEPQPYDPGLWGPGMPPEQPPEQPPPSQPPVQPPAQPPVTPEKEPADPFETIAGLYGSAMAPTGPPQYMVTPAAQGSSGGGINPTFVGIAAVAIVGWLGYRWWKRHHK